MKVLQIITTVLFAVLVSTSYGQTIEADKAYERKMIESANKDKPNSDIAGNYDFVNNPGFTKANGYKDLYIETDLRIEVAYLIPTVKSVAERKYYRRVVAISTKRDLGGDVKKIKIQERTFYVRLGKDI